MILRLVGSPWKIGLSTLIAWSTAWDSLAFWLRAIGDMNVTSRLSPSRRWGSGRSRPVRLSQSKTLITAGISHSA